MIRVAYFDLTTKIVSAILSGDIDLSAFPPPVAGEQNALLLNDTLEKPLYFDGYEFQPLPEKPGQEYVWDGLTTSWVADIYTAGEARSLYLLGQRDYFRERGFYFTYGGVSKDVPCTVENLGRIRDAALLAERTTISDPFDIFVKIGNKPQPITRAQAIDLHNAVIAHMNAVDIEDNRLGIEAADIYNLAETDLPAALAAMAALNWTYIPHLVVGP